MGLVLRAERHRGSPCGEVSWITGLREASVRGAEDSGAGPTDIPAGIRWPGPAACTLAHRAAAVILPVIHGNPHAFAGRMTVEFGGGMVIERLGREASGGRFRVEDERGAVAWLARGRAYEHLHAIEFRAAGVRRGFHAHPATTETLYVMAGRLMLFARGSEDGGTVSAELSAGDVATFAPGVAHGFVALEPAFAVALGTGADPLAEGGTVPAPDLG
ncbi:MAG: hypothetical protein JWM27_3453 [Gemmatimonadetes bacterium]|nr:hypothetical protein [Gemmatimonadota bacterium]